MDDVGYDEIVSLHRKDRDTRTMTLAEAVRIIIHTDGKLHQAMYTIVPENRRMMKLAEVEAIYSRPDFPKATG